MDWSKYYPDHFSPPEDDEDASEVKKSLKQVEFADIGCGYGGLLGESLN